MKKIKLFFVRNYQRFIRFLISFSAVGCIACVTLFASAAVSLSVPFSRPQISSDSFYLELNTPNFGPIVIYGSVYCSSLAPSVPLTSSFSARVGADGLLYIERDGGNVYTSGDQRYTLYFAGYYVYQNGNVGVLPTSDSSTYFYFDINATGLTGIHGYNCDVSLLNSSITSNDFTFVYGNDNRINDKLDAILATLQDNKSSAEKEIYSGATSEQKESQKALGDSEKKIADDTASARASTVDVFQSFKIVGSIANGMLAVSNLFRFLTDDLALASPLLNFSLAIGAGAFLLGLSSIILRSGGRKK